MEDTGRENPRLGACDWCGKDARQRLVLVRARKLKHGWRSERAALVCSDHARHFATQDEVGRTAEVGW